MSTLLILLAQCFGFFLSLEPIWNINHFVVPNRNTGFYNKHPREMHRVPFIQHPPPPPGFSTQPKCQDAYLISSHLE